MMIDVYCKIIITMIILKIISIAILHLWNKSNYKYANVMIMPIIKCITKIFCILHYFYNVDIYPFH